MPLAWQLLRIHRMRSLFAIQGIFYFLTGVWPIVHISSFMAVTGPKVDIWLVKTVGALLTVSGVAFCLESRARQPSRNLGLLALAQAGVLAFIDIYYVANRVIPPIYLADAPIELLLVGFWVVALVNYRRHS